MRGTNLLHPEAEEVLCFPMAAELCAEWPLGSQDESQTSSLTWRGCTETSLTAPCNIWSNAISLAGELILSLVRAVLRNVCLGIMFNCPRSCFCVTESPPWTGSGQHLCWEYCSRLTPTSSVPSWRCISRVGLKFWITVSLFFLSSKWVQHFLSSLGSVLVEGIFPCHWDACTWSFGSC